MSTLLLPAQTGSGPFQRLLERARQSPQRDAIHSKRRGVWTGHRWSALAHDAVLAARGWASLGVRAGDRIVMLGPLSAPWVVTQFAADAIGAHVVAATDDTADALIAGARHVFADGAHDLERLLRHRSGALHRVVLGDARFLADAPLPDGVVAHDALLLAAQAALEWLPPAQPCTPLRDAGRDQRVLADFHAAWAPGVAFLLQEWVDDAPLLLIPEAGGDALADRREALATVWLTSAQRLNRFDQDVRGRVPAGPVGGFAARAVLAGGRSPLTRLARWRARVALGVAHVRSVRTDAALAPSLRAALDAIGIAPGGVVPDAVRTPTASRAASPGRATAVPTRAESVS